MKQQRDWRDKFKRGDFIKAKHNSRFEPEHWVYVVVHVVPEALMALDLNGNITWIDGDWPEDLEVIEPRDKYELEEVNWVKAGEADDRFTHWVEDYEKKKAQ